MEQKKIKERTQKHLDDYARRGLRTLCIAKKVIFLIHIFRNACDQSEWSGGADTVSKQLLPLPHFVYPYILLGGICKLTQINS